MSESAMDLRAYIKANEQFLNQMPGFLCLSTLDHKYGMDVTHSNLVDYSRFILDASKKK